MCVCACVRACMRACVRARMYVSHVLDRKTPKWLMSPSPISQGMHSHESVIFSYF